MTVRVHASAHIRSVPSPRLRAPSSPPAGDAGGRVWSWGRGAGWQLGHGPGPEGGPPADGLEPRLVRIGTLWGLWLLYVT
jgi:hypothetical protein